MIVERKRTRRSRKQAGTIHLCQMSAQVHCLCLPAEDGQEQKRHFLHIGCDSRIRKITLSGRSTPRFLGRGNLGRRKNLEALDQKRFYSLEKKRDTPIENFRWLQYRLRWSGRDRAVANCRGPQDQNVEEMTTLVHCHFSVKIDRFPDKLPRGQAPLEDELSHIIWRCIVRSSFFVPRLPSSTRSLNLAPGYLEDAPTNA
jgi:hypothetical protein